MQIARFQCAKFCMKIFGFNVLLFYVALHTGMWLSLLIFLQCYIRNAPQVCRFCYYRRKSSRLVSSSSDHPYCAKCQQQCETIWLMPASRLCENFGNLREIPIPPAPRWFFKNANKPFGFCERNDHYSCFEMSASSEIWFAHTIEELVIWTIEREHSEFE